MADLEKIEDALYSAIDRAVTDSALQGPWAQVLQKFQQDGSSSGNAALAAVEQL